MTAYPDVMFRRCGGPIGAQQVLGAFFTAMVSLDVKCEPLPECRTTAIFGKGRDMDKDIRSTQVRRDEAKTPIIVPLREFAVDTHLQKLSQLQDRSRKAASIRQIGYL